MKMKKFLALALSMCTVFSMSTVVFADDTADGSMEYPYTFTDGESKQGYSVDPMATVYFNLDFDQFEQIDGKVLQISHDGMDMFGTPIQIQYGNPMLGNSTTVSDGGEGDLDGAMNGVIIHTIDLSKMQGFALYNQNPRMPANIDIDIVTYTPPAPGETASTAVELESTTDVETSVKEAEYYDGNTFYYKYTTEKAGFFYFWVDDVKVDGTSVDNIDVDIFIESMAWSSSVLSEGTYNKNTERTEAYVYLEEGEEVIIEVSTDAEMDMTTGNYSERPAADIIWSAKLVEGTAEDPIIAPSDSFQFKFPAGVKIVLSGEFAQKLLTITNGYNSYEWDGEVVVLEKVYVEYDSKKNEVNEEGTVEVAIGGDRNSDELVSVTIGEAEDRLGNFNVTFTSLPAEDKTVITVESLEKLGATVKDNAEGTELVVAPITWDTFDVVKTLVADTFKEKAYQMMDIKLINDIGVTVQPEDGKPVSITMKLPEALGDATKVAVSRYDETTKKLVDVATVDVVDGKLTFKAEHFSTYVFADATPVIVTPPAPPVVTPDNTADMAPVAMALVIAVAAAVVVLKKRETAEN